MKTLICKAAVGDTLYEEKLLVIFKEAREPGLKGSYMCDDDSDDDDDDNEHDDNHHNDEDDHVVAGQCAGRAERIFPHRCQPGNVQFLEASTVELSPYTYM